MVRRGERQTARSGFLLATIGALADSAGWWLTSTIVGRGTCYQDPVNSDVSICGEAAWQSILALALIVAGGVLLLYIMWRLAVTLARAPTAANLVAFVVLWALSVGVVTIGTLFAVFQCHDAAARTMAACQDRDPRGWIGVCVGVARCCAHRFIPPAKPRSSDWGPQHVAVALPALDARV